MNLIQTYINKHGVYEGPDTWNGYIDIDIRDRHIIKSLGNLKVVNGTFIIGGGRDLYNSFIEAPELESIIGTLYIHNKCPSYFPKLRRVAKTMCSESLPYLPAMDVIDISIGYSVHTYEALTQDTKRIAEAPITDLILLREEMPRFKDIIDLKLKGIIK